MREIHIVFYMYILHIIYIINVNQHQIEKTLWKKMSLYELHISYRSKYDLLLHELLMFSPLSGANLSNQTSFDIFFHGPR